MGDAMEGHELESMRSNVLRESENLEGFRTEVKGYDFDRGVNYSELVECMATTGYQASILADATKVVNQMLDWKLSDEPIAEDCDEEQKDMAFRENVKCKIFLGFTSNLISSGLRETIRYLVKHHMVHVVVTTAGGVEEDLIKCFGPTYIGDFSLPGELLREKGLNRIGNLLIPNENYCKFQDWIIPIFNQMLEEQKTEDMLWTPSRVIARLGKELNNESSYVHWAYKNNVPVFCPGLTDGSLGDMLHLHSIKNPGLVVDIVQDIKAVNGEAIHASPHKTGVIILGGGLPKHHICNANMMRNGADFAVFINTAQEFDGSDSGASPDEAVSWGKLRASAKSVKVHCDATIAFPFLVAKTFARREEAPIALAKPEKSSPNVPPYLEMITDAVTMLKEKNGSSQQVIQKLIEQKQKNQNYFGKPFLWHLKRLLSAVKLLKVKASFKLSETKRKPKPKATSEMKLKNKAKSVVTPKANVASMPKAKPAIKANAYAAAKIART